MLGFYGSDTATPSGASAAKTPYPFAMRTVSAMGICMSFLWLVRLGEILARQSRLPFGGSRESCMAEQQLQYRQLLAVDQRQCTRYSQAETVSCRTAQRPYGGISKAPGDASLYQRECAAGYRQRRQSCSQENFNHRRVSVYRMVLRARSELTSYMFPPKSSIPCSTTMSVRKSCTSSQRKHRTCST